MATAKSGHTDFLVAPSPEQRQAFLSLPRTEEVHAAVMAELACMNRVEAPSGPNGVGALTFPLTVAAWNLERCYFPDASADLVAAQGAQVVLLSEVDNGMARTSQRHTAGDIAAALDMNYAYGVEFLELTLGNSIEQVSTNDNFNVNGFHGNALMAPVALHQPTLIRLDQRGRWFRPESREHRVGGRCAVAARLSVADREIAAVSVHLESDSDQAYRAQQMTELLDHVDELADGQPVIIGGDFNTGVSDDADFEKETLWSVTAARGYDRYSGALDQPTTRESMVTRNPERSYKLDWILTRGFSVGGSHIVPAIGPDGNPLSDHDMVVVRVDGFS